MLDILNTIINAMAIGFGLTFGVIGAIGYFKIMGALIDWLMKKAGYVKHNYLDLAKHYTAGETVRFQGQNYQTLALPNHAKRMTLLKNLSNKVNAPYVIINSYTEDELNDFNKSNIKNEEDTAEPDRQ